MREEQYPLPGVENRRGDSPLNMLTAGLDDGAIVQMSAP